MSRILLSYRWGFLALAGWSFIASLKLEAIPVRVLAWDESVSMMKLSLRDAKGTVAIEGMHPLQRSQPYPVQMGKVPVAIEVLEKMDSKGRPIQTPVNFPPTIKRALLIILPDEDSPGGIRAKVIEDDQSDFDKGTIRFINATGQAMIFAYEDKTAQLPASWNPLNIHPGGGLRSMGVKLFLDPTKRAVYSAVWEHQPAIRMLVFLIPGKDPRHGPVELKMISEDYRDIPAIAPP